MGNQTGGQAVSLSLRVKGSPGGHARFWGKPAMRYVCVLATSLLFLALNAYAQVNFADSVTLLTPSFVTNSSPAPAPPFNNPASPSAVNAPTITPVLARLSLSPPQPPPQGVQGVFENYSYDAYVGYTFVRFYEVPGTSPNLNGVNGSFTGWYRDWFGGDVEVFALYGRQSGQNSWMVFGGIGPRFRYVGVKGIDLWVHGLVGGTYFTPQTPYGGQGAVGGVVGGGVDLNAHHRHMALRIGVDAIATHFFGTYQVSPKASAGIVYKF
jgi:hypothetical protein